MSWPFSTYLCISPFCVNNRVLIVKIDPYREGKWVMKPNSYWSPFHDSDRLSSYKKYKQ